MMTESTSDQDRYQRGAVAQLPPGATGSDYDPFLA
jgi:hypothetical protein